MTPDELSENEESKGDVTIVAVDPGRNVGVAVVDESGRLLRSEIVELADLERLEFPAEARIIVGNGTGSERVQSVLERRGLAPRLVDEDGTSLEGRKLYFRDHPPRPPLAWLPAGLWWPPRLTDDYAAYAIALRHLRASSVGEGREISEEQSDVAGRV